MNQEKPQSIGIIGGLGQMGTKFRNAFVEKGYDVKISDIDTELSNVDIASSCDVVIVCVPIHDTEAVLKEITPYMKPGSLLTDMTSVKTFPMETMKKYHSKDVSYAGGHPLFAPSTDWDKQHFIICEGDGDAHVSWYKDFLTGLGLTVMEMTTEEHDRHMAVIQCLTHFSNVSLGSALEKLQYDLHTGERISTAIYQMRLYGVGRILAQDSALYADIQRFNPYAREVSQVYLKAVQELCDSISDKDTVAFVSIFKKCQVYFGDLKEKSLQITNKLIKAINSYE